MVLQSCGRFTNFQTPISVKPLNSSWEVASHLSLFSEFNASWYELGASWNMLINTELILSPEGWCWWANQPLVRQREYRGVGGSGIAGPWPDPEGCMPGGTTGGAMGGFAFEISMQIGQGWVALKEVGLGWLVPVPMYLIHYQIQKLAGHSEVPVSTLWISLLSQETEFLWISQYRKFWSIGESHVPKLVSLGSRFITNEDHLSTLGVKFVSPLF